VAPKLAGRFTGFRALRRRRRHGRDAHAASEAEERALAVAE
jgi:hypothetical protein